MSDLLSFLCIQLLLSAVAIAFYVHRVRDLAHKAILEANEAVRKADSTLVELQKTHNQAVQTMITLDAKVTDLSNKVAMQAMRGVGNVGR